MTSHICIKQEEFDNLHKQLEILKHEVQEALRLIHYDALTSALNRRGLVEAFDRELANVNRTKNPLSICMLDIDNFKSINDSYGHPTGDKVLVHVVKIIKACIRPLDSVVRYGGEEFLILMPNTSRDQGVQAIERLQFSLNNSPLVVHEKQKISLAFSAGVAQILDSESMENLIERADASMYEAKHAGKNCVKVAD